MSKQDTRARATTRIPEHLHQWLQVKAKEKGVSLNKKITMILSEAKAKDLQKQLEQTAS